MPKGKVGFEYQKKKKESPFETFLRYTDEKEKSSRILAKILRSIIGKNHIDFLDIGAGNGEYLKMTLDKLKLDIKANFVLLEPSQDLVKGLKKTIKSFPKNSNVKILTKTWEEFRSKWKFDVILASHLYHLPKEEYPSHFLKMINLLKAEGHLIFVLRKIDDPYHFKMKFKPLFFGKGFKASTLDDALRVFEKISKEKIPLKIKTYQSFSKLHIPLDENFNDVVSIIEFYLNIPWEKISQKNQKEIVKFINQKQKIFHQIDGLALIKRLK